MTSVILVVHVLIAIAMVVVVLVQRSDGGALGGIGGGSSFGGAMGGRQSANLLTRATAVLGGSFMATSMLLAILASGTGGPRSLTDSLPAAPAAPVLPAPEDPVTGPQVPVAE